MKRAVALLGEKEVQSLMEREGKIEVSGPRRVLLMLQTVRDKATLHLQACGAMNSVVEKPPLVMQDFRDLV